MPGSDFDVNTPSPDDGHEAIRRAVVQAIEDLGYTADDAGLSLDMADTLFSLLEGALDWCDALAVRIEEQSARIDALEAAAVPTDPTLEVAP